MNKYVWLFIVAISMGFILFFTGCKKEGEMDKKRVIILFGVPGTGKSTQGKMMQKELGLPHISTGDLLRNAFSKGTELGKKAKEYMNRGDLVPDALVVEILQARLQEEDSKRGFMLDGFPRNLAQIEILDEMLVKEGYEITDVVNIEIPMEEAVKRLGGRRICSSCSASYHTEHKAPKEDGVCDICGGELIQRKDDSKEAIEKRFVEYESNTAPVKQYYAEKELIRSIDGIGEIEKIYSEIMKKLAK